MMMNKIKKFLSKKLRSLKTEWQFLLSNQKPLLFDHLPKCGGTAVNRFLIKHYPKESVFGLSGINPRQSVTEFRNLPQSVRWQKKLVYGHLANELIAYVRPNTLAVTVFREPIDRIISHYYYVKQTPNHYLYDRLEKEQISLKDYCSLGLSPELSNWYVIHFTGLTHSEVLKDPEHAINLAYNNILETYSIIGFQDAIPEFIDVLKVSLSLKTAHNIQKKNTTKHRLRVTDLDMKTLGAITQYNELDIQLYNKLVALKQNGIVYGYQKAS